MMLFKLNTIREYYCEYVEEYIVYAENEEQAREMCNIGEFGTSEGLDREYDWRNPKYAICEVVELDKPKIISDSVCPDRSY